MSVLSVKTISQPEFVNVVPYNHLYSQCEIKVLYIGENRNKTFISKEVAAEMANSLPGCPIVGHYIEEKEDYGAHDNRITVDESGMHFECLTMPYGFVAPDAKVWFQKFEEVNGFGEKVVREYLMTTGYLWTGQFEEAKRIVEKGNGQSMELDNDSLEGTWAMSEKLNCEFFIINDATFSKLCILGEDVEPCFEGANIKPLSNHFSKNDKDFKNTYYNMMQDFKFALQEQEKGGNTMPEITNAPEVEVEVVETPIETVTEETEVVEESVVETAEEVIEEEVTEVAEETEPVVEEEIAEEVETVEEEIEQVEDSESIEEEEKNLDNDEQIVQQENNINTEGQASVEEYQALEQKYSLLEIENNNLKTEIEALRTFKLEVEDQKKDALIDSFYMLSDEDKKEVIENKANYSLDDIEAKLSVVCVRKRVNFDLDTNDNDTAEKPAMTYNLETEVTAPAWIKAVQNTKNRKKY